MEHVGLAATEWLMSNLDKYSFTDRFLHSLTLFSAKAHKEIARNQTISFISLLYTTPQIKRSTHDHQRTGLIIIQLVEQTETNYLFLEKYSVSSTVIIIYQEIAHNYKI